MTTLTGARLYTVGHSTHSIEHLVKLLREHGVTALCDVRSAPYSRLNPQFNRETLRDALRGYEIRYVFLGEELGARSSDPACYERGKVQYERVARTELFRRGLERLREGMLGHTLALMCAEKDPLSCHRMILVSRPLFEAGLDVEHILEDGTLESHDQALTRLMQQLKIPEGDMFRSRDECVAEAYAIQAEKIAYEEADWAQDAADQTGTKK